jgi:hypothetical protein
MAVRVFCNSPQQLLAEIKGAIREGTVQTWSVDSDGDLTHSPEQWRNKAWFRPRLEPGKLLFIILSPRGIRMSKETYAVFHGRLIEMLLAHFDVKFARATATSLPSDGDKIGP